MLGAGVMGAQIAAHFANAGLRVLLLDVTSDAAREGLQRATKLKPDPFFTPDAAGARFAPAASTRTWRPSREADWIVEAIVERLDAKQALMARVDAVRRDDAIVSSNTSGIPIASIAEGRSDSFRRHWLGTHFFNPPRYLHLLELIPTAETDPEVVRVVTEFADHRLGKGVVLAKDVPGFIANRIGVYGLTQVFRAIESGEFTIEEVDAITGPAIGRPKSATFRTVDIAGVDVLAHVARTLSFELPAFVETMVARGMTGREGRRRLLQEGRATRSSRSIRRRSSTARSSRRSCRRSRPPAPSSRSATGSARSTRARTRSGAFLRATLGPTLDYAEKIADEIAYSREDIDKAMRWGFGWELGPFETRASLTDSAPLPTPRSPTPRPPSSRAPASGSFARTPDASLIDMGDGVLQIEFHSKMNAIGGDTMQMLHAGVKEASQNFTALVVGNDAPNFSAGANLMLLLLEAQEGNWDEVDLMIRAFQGATMALKHADVPVVVAPAGLALGGGCEIALHGARVQAAAETYIGLVEVGVGLIPAGGGTKEMLARAMEALPPGADPLPHVQRVFETIGFAKVSTSGPDARRHRLPARRRRDHDEPRSPARRREGARAAARARLHAGAAASRRFVSAARASSPRSSSASTSPGAPAASAITTR